LSTHLEPSLDLVRADTGQLRQVLLNLVVNARDAMPQGGSLTISTSNRELNDKDAALAGISAGKYVELTVADTGTGMTEEVQSHLFEPFYTTKEQGKGTGLGLSTAYGIVRHHDGHIEVESEPGKGACFKILLPALAP
jgi:two-component system, cell cycle sensor histidine kinase and response regulator CckA